MPQIDKGKLEGWIRAWKYDRGVPTRMELAAMLEEVFVFIQEDEGARERTDHIQSAD